LFRGLYDDAFVNCVAHVASSDKLGRTWRDIGTFLVAN